MAPTLAALLRRLDPAALDPMGDDALLHKYAATGDRDALAALVHRHGPLVYRVCRQLLRPDDVEDGFQATFLVLARRAGAVRKAGSVGSWLVGVAGRVAREARRAERRRARREVPLVGEVADVVGAGSGDLECAEQVRLLHEELARLPDQLRGPAVSCLLQGRTSDEAAAELGSSPRTVRRHVEQARRVLRARLERRGVVPAVAAVLMADVGGGTAAVPVVLFRRTGEVLNDSFTGGTSRPVALARLVANSMTTPNRVTLAAFTIACVSVIGAGLAAESAQLPLPSPRASTLVTTPVPKDTTPPVYYYPTKVGDQWVYREDGQKETRFVSRVEKKGQDLVVTVSESRERGGRLDRVWERVTVSPSGVSRTHSAPFDLAPPFQVLKSPYQTGNVWGGTLAYMAPGERLPRFSGDYRSTACGPERVKVAAGVFMAVRVEVESRIGTIDKMMYWYAPGVGEVKAEDDGRITSELLSFTPGRD